MNILSGFQPSELSTDSREVFSEDIIKTLDIISKNLIKGIKNREVGDEYLYFAMWIRKKNLKRYKNIYNGKNIRGRGLTIHIAPSNVPTNALFTLVFGLLSGNSVAMRVSKRSRKDLLEPLRILDRTKSELRYLFSIFECAYDDLCFKELSDKAKALVIWGGNQTIENVISEFSNKKIKILSFANKTSLSVINLNWLDTVDADHKKIAAKLFARDLFSFGQKACSSPKLLVATGELNMKIKKELIDFLGDVSNEGIKMKEKGVKARDCYINAEEFAMKHGKENMINSKNLYCPLFKDRDKEIGISELYQAGNDGCLPIIHSNKWENISKYTQDNSQTMILIGLSDEQEEKIYLETKNTSITRYAKPGSALNIDIIWDGYDIVEELTRKIRYE